MPPVPAASGVQSEPSSRVPKPCSGTGAWSVSERTRSGRSSSSCSTTPPPIDHPTTCAPVTPSASSTEATSSEKSRSPRVASTGSVSLSPKPRRSIAIVGRGSASMSGCQNSDDETLPCTSTTVLCGGAAGSSSTRSRICVASREEVTMREEMPSNRVAAYRSSPAQASPVTWPPLFGKMLMPMEDDRQLSPPSVER